MRVHRRTNLYQTRAIAQSVLHEIDRWCGIDIILDSGLSQQQSILQVARKVESFFGPDSDGELFIRSGCEIAVLAKSPIASDAAGLRKELSEKVLPYGTSVNCEPLTIGYLKGMEERASQQLHNAVNFNFATQKSRSLRSKKVVFVVDHADFVHKAIESALGQNCDVRAFDTTDEVVDRYLECFPDIVFADVLAKGNLNGMALLDKIRSYDDVAYVILQTDQASREKVMQAKALGAQGFLIKPFSGQKIEDIMRAYEARKR